MAEVVDANMALFCDLENIALGVEATKLDKFTIKPVLERLLLKGSIVVKKAYCDWERYKAFKPALHEAAFELIEIPHLRMSGKNSADIRMVVDALDLCYTKEHIDTFVIISGDSDFSPLVSKLRENAKVVIGMGVRNSTSDLLASNCHEFIFYDDLIAEQSSKKTHRRRKSKKATGSKKRPESKREASAEDAVDVGIDLLIETAEALQAERGDREKLWGSMIKQTLKRRQPGFSESSYGFRAFSDLLEEAQSRGLIELELDEKIRGLYRQVHNGRLVACRSGQALVRRRRTRRSRRASRR